jgi:hypothetical protein
VLLGLRARRSRAERDQSGADPQRSVDHRLDPAGGLLADPLGTFTVAITPDHFTGLPQRERHQADRNQPQQDLAKGLISQCSQRPGGVGALCRRAPRDLQRQPADQEVNNAVGDQPDAGQHLQRRAVAGLFSLAAGTGCHRRGPPPGRRAWHRGAECPISGPNPGNTRCCAELAGFELLGLDLFTTAHSSAASGACSATST